MHKKHFIFFVFTCLFLISFLASPSCAMHDEDEHTSIKSPQHSINTVNTNDEELLALQRQETPHTCCRGVRRVLCCFYACPACCKACKDPDIIDSFPDGSEIYNSNTPTSLRFSIPKDESDIPTARERFKRLNRWCF